MIFLTPVSLSKYKRCALVLSTELCAGTVQEWAGLGCTSSGDCAISPASVGSCGQWAVSVQGQSRHSLQALLLLWEMKITAFSALCGCCEYEHVKLYEV